MRLNGRAAPVGGAAAWLAVLVALLVTACGPGADPAATAIVETADGRHAFSVEIADDDAERARGLMFRERIAEDDGMLFDFGAEREITMWMKNTLVSLDMVFIRADGRVHRIAERTTPLSLATIASNGPARAVLEIRGGRAAEIGLMPGDLVRHPMFGNAGD